MDGLVVLLLIGWVIKAFNKKKSKKAKNRTVGARLGEATKQRAERAVQMYDAVKKREAQKASVQLDMFAVPDVQPGEGEGYAPPEYTGSLMMDSSEGEDLCDPALEHDQEIIIEPESVYANEIGREPLLDFSAKGLLQGIVMSEVLTRPTQRRR